MADRAEAVTNRGIRPHLFSLALLLLALACSSSQAANPAPVETQVAGTLTALAPTLPPQSAPTMTSEPEPPAATPTPSSEVDIPAVEAWKLAYIDDGRPWILGETSGPRQLSSLDGVYDVLISSDGQVVVFARRPAPVAEPMPSELYEVHADGSQQRLLLDGTDFDGLYPLEGFLHNDLGMIAFVPNSHRLLLNTRVIPEGPGLIKRDDLLRLDADSGELEFLLPPGQGGDFTLSPDGSKAALVQPDSLHLVNSDGSNLRQDLVTFEPLITYSEFQFYVLPVWSSDGSQLAVVIPTADILAEDPGASIWRLDADGGEVEMMAAMQGDFYFSERSGVSSLAPDFSRVAFRAPGSSNRDLMIAPVGGAANRYDTDVVQWWGWNADGSRFAYAKGAPQNAVLGSSGSAPEPPFMGTNLRWIDASSFFFTQGSVGDWTLNRRVIGAGTTELLRPSSDFIRFDFVHP